MPPLNFCYLPHCGIMEHLEKPHKTLIGKTDVNQTSNMDAQPHQVGLDRSKNLSDSKLEDEDSDNNSLHPGMRKIHEVISRNESRPDLEEVIQVLECPGSDETYCVALQLLIGASRVNPKGFKKHSDKSLEAVLALLKKSTLKRDVRISSFNLLKLYKPTPDLPLYCLRMATDGLNDPKDKEMTLTCLDLLHPYMVDESFTFHGAVRMLTLPMLHNFAHGYNICNQTFQKVKQINCDLEVYLIVRFITGLMTLPRVDGFISRVITFWKPSVPLDDIELAVQQLYLALIKAPVFYHAFEKLAEERKRHTNKSHEPELKSPLEVFSALFRLAVGCPKFRYYPAIQESVLKFLLLLDENPKLVNRYREWDYETLPESVITPLHAVFSSVIPEVISLSRNSNARSCVRQAAMIKVSKLANQDKCHRDIKAGIPKIVKCLYDKDENVRRAASDALGTLFKQASFQSHAKEVDEYLAKCLNSKNKVIRQIALDAMVKLRSKA